MSDNDLTNTPETGQHRLARQAAPSRDGTRPVAPVAIGTQSAGRFPLDPTADKPRIIIDYGGMQLLDCREYLRIKLLGEPPKGVRWSLKNAGFKPMPGDSATFFRTTNPQAIFDAQMIGATFFKSEKDAP